jgi:hypothetical protein
MSFSLFSIASNDQSIYYLGQIFGKVSGVLTPANSPLLLGVMFKVLNTAALTLGAMIVTYTTVVGLLATAAEGEFLGKKWHGLWVPIRTVIGIVGLFPSSGGYCAIQVIIMWLIIQGIGLGDSLWTAVMAFLNENGGSAYASVSFPKIEQQITPKMQKLFSGLVCRASMNSTYTLGSDSARKYYCQAVDDNACGTSLPEFDPKSGSYDLGFDCGTLRFNSIDSAKPSCQDPNSQLCILSKAQAQVFPGIITVLDKVAQKFVQLDYEYQQFWYDSTIDTAKAQTEPEWIQNFCVANKIPLQNCCTDKDSAKALQRKIFLWGRKRALNIPVCAYSFFLNKFPPYKSTVEANSTGPEALKKIYVPYGMKPYLDNSDFIQPVVDQYIGALTEAYTNYLSSTPPAPLSGWYKQSQAEGWIFAGMYYFRISKANAERQVSIDKLATFDVSEPSGVATKDNKYRNNIDPSNLQELFDTLAKEEEDNSLLGNNPKLSAIKKSTSNLPSGTIQSLVEDVAGTPGKGNSGLIVRPLAHIASFGYSLMWGTQLAFVATAVAVAAVQGIWSSNFIVVGTGMTTSPWYEFAKALWGFFSPFYILLISALFSLGAILGVYLPLIPYTIFTMGAIGWMMAAIEAMVAGPIIALGILSPSGQHELLGKAEPAVLILFNLILRPSLMVFGMMASLLVASVVVTMINQSFARVAYDIIPHPALVEWTVFLIAYTSLLVTAMSKVFSLIHVIPEKVLTYIGGQAISYGEGEGLAGMKQAMEGGAGAIAGGGKEAGGAFAGGVQKVQQDAAHEKAEDKGAIQAGNKPKGRSSGTAIGNRGSGNNTPPAAGG